MLSPDCSNTATGGMEVDKRTLATTDISIQAIRNMRGLGKSMVVFRLFQKLIYSNERLSKFESPYHE